MGYAGPEILAKIYCGDSCATARESRELSPVRGETVIRIVFAFEGGSGYTQGMRGNSEAIPQTVRAGPTPILARLGSEVAELPSLRTQWLAHAKADGARPKGLAAYEWMVRRACEEHGWTDLGHVTTPAVMAHIDGHREAQPKGWSAGTAKLCLAAFRSFDRFLRLQGYPGLDRLDLVRGAKGKTTKSARASTTEEAREFLYFARERRMGDGRVRGHPDVQAAMYFLAAMRECEPGKLRWRDNVYLDEPIPLIRWLDDEDGHKNRTVVEIAIAPELVEILRNHREDMRRLAASMEFATGPTDRSKTARRRIDPDHPEAHVLPWVTNAKTYRAYRDEIGIEAKDRRGRSFSAHSARRWFATTLMLEGVHEKMISVLMRHTSYVGDRYKDPPLADMAQALNRLPRLLEPLKTTPQPVNRARKISNSDSFSVAEVEKGRYGVVSEVNATPLPTNLNDVPGPRVAALASEITLPAWAGYDVEPFGHGPSRAQSRASATVIQTPNSDHTIGDKRPLTETGLKSAVADLTRAFARVIEEITRGSSGGGMAAG